MNVCAMKSAGKIVDLLEINLPLFLKVKKVNAQFEILQVECYCLLPVNIVQKINFSSTDQNNFREFTAAQQFFEQGFARLSCVSRDQGY